MLFGIGALLTGRTAEIITISVFGAITLYIISMITVVVLRKKEPGLQRPFRVPFYPAFPIIALTIALGSLVAMLVYNQLLGGIYFLILLGSFAVFKIFSSASLK
jgi:ethanolamine permease